MEWKGTLLSLAVLAALGLAAPLVRALFTWLKAKSDGTRFATLVPMVESVVMSFVAHAEVSLRPRFATSMSGKLTPDGGVALKSEVLGAVKAALADNLPGLKKTLGLATEEALDTYLSGLVERSLGVQRAAGTLPPPRPASTALGSAPDVATDPALPFVRPSGG